MSSREPMAAEPEAIDTAELRRRVQEKYQEVAFDPDAEYHFFTGRRATRRLGYPSQALDGLPGSTIDAFAGVANPFHWGSPEPGERVVDVGSGGGLDSVIAARAVGDDGRVVGVDMTTSMLERARSAAQQLGLDQLEFRRGLAEDLPVPDGWADLVISNGVLNLVPDKMRAYQEILRVLRPGGRLQVADIYVEQAIPAGAQRDIDLWTG